VAEICDYEGSSYRTDFWEGQGREYEDLAERIALRKLLPAAGARLMEIGAGFGRLVDLYDGYRQVVLLDYSKSMLRQAQERLGRGGKYIYVAADLYAMPFVDSLFDTTRDGARAAPRAKHPRRLPGDSAGVKARGGLRVGVRQQTPPQSRPALPAGPPELEPLRP